MYQPGKMMQVSLYLNLDLKKCDFIYCIYVIVVFIIIIIIIIIIRRFAAHLQIPEFTATRTHQTFWYARSVSNPPPFQRRVDCLEMNTTNCRSGLAEGYTAPFSNPSAVPHLGSRIRHC
jgi:hypothetical protein